MGRLLRRIAPSNRREADRQRRAIMQAGAALHPDAVLVVDAGCGVAALRTAGVTRLVARVARHLAARRTSLPVDTGRGRSPVSGERVRPLPRTHTGKTWPPRLPMPPRRGWWPGGRSRPRGGTTWCGPRPSPAARHGAGWSSMIRALRHRSCWRQLCRCPPLRCGVCPATAGRSSQCPGRPSRGSVRTARWCAVGRAATVGRSWRGWRAISWPLWPPPRRRWPRACGIGAAVRRVGAYVGCCSA